MTMSGNEGMAPIGAHPDVVRVAGLEPALLSEQDFESSASTNSTTPAQVWEARNLAAETVGSIAVRGEINAFGNWCETR